MKQQNLQVGAYTRLSRDDDNIGESGSIVMQKEIIRQYCERNGMAVKTYYQDDGFTGTNYNRPDFQRMTEGIESGEINCVITKDLSRLGRDYIMTGYYTEIYFPEHSVRYIAIGDNYDTQDKNNSNNDFAPFKFIVNDLYAKDISKKIRASKNAKFLNGEQLVSHPPYGYKKDPNLKNHYIIDEETAPVVRKIFEMYANGVGRNTIVKYLRDNKILMPAAVLHVRGIRYSKQMEICFHGGEIAEDVPEDYREHIQVMRDSFAVIDGIVNELNAKMENGDSLDPIQIKVVFYSLFFGADQSSAVDCRKFADCFVTYEEHTRIVTMEDGKTKEETYTVPVPIKDLSVVYQNINTAMGKAVTYENMANATEIYYRIAYGTAAPLEDDSTTGWEGWKYQRSEEEVENLYHDLQAGENGSEIVKLAMSRLGDPYSQEKRGQGSYTDCSYLTMWCYKQFGISFPGTAAEQGR